MQHLDALRDGAAERYVLGELTEQQVLEYEAHFFECTECAEEVKAAAALAEAARDVFQAETTRRTAREVPRGRGRAWRLPALAAAAALAAGVAAYQAAVVVPALRREVAQVDALQPAPWFFLSVSRAQPPVVELGKGQRRVGLTLSRSSERSHPYYRCQLVDAGGKVVEAVTVPAPARDGELQILLPASRLAPGAYAIEVAGLETPGVASPQGEVVRYHFELRRQEGERP